MLGGRPPERVLSCESLSALVGKFACDGKLLAFALRLSVCECVTQNPGRAIKIKEAAALRPATIAAAQGDKDEPGTNSALQAVRSAMSMFNLITGTVVGSDGYRVQCRHAGQAYTILWGPPFVFTTPNLADTRNATLLLVQG